MSGDHFPFPETACNCCEYDGTTQLFRNVIEAIRHHVKGPVSGSSFYRCPSHNESESGKWDSYHIFGLAGDFTRIGPYRANTEQGRDKIAEILELFGMWTYKGSSFVHGDLRYMIERNTRNG